jgi:Concanavalin A-like lectin/glucanases superfamily
MELGGTTQWKFLNVDKVTKISALCRDGVNIIGVSNQLTIKPKNSWIKPVITTPTTTFCTAEKVLLTATGCDYKIKWSPYGLIGKDSTFKMDLSAGNQQIYARCQAQDGCLSSASDTMNVRVYKSPAAPYAMGPPNDGTFPKGSIVTLNVNSILDPYSPLGVIMWYVKRPNGIYIDTITAQNTINYTLNETVIIEVASKTRTCENRRVVNQYNVDNTTNIACYTLNGNAQDGSGNNRHGEIVGNVISTTDRFNNPNGALYFPGNANSWVKVIPPFYVGPSLTINVWIYRELGSSNYVLGQGRKDILASWFGIVCGDEYWGKPGFGVKYGAFNPDISYAYSSDNLQNNAWYMLTGILDIANDKIKFYVNGVKKGEANYPYKNSLPSLYGFPFAIGRNTASAYDFETYGTWETYPYKGKIDDLCLFNRAMTDTEVAALYNSGTCPQMYSINSGSWDNPSTWSCNRVPIFSDVVVVSSGHIVTVPNGTFHAKNVLQNGTLNFQPLGEIKIYGN